jgi:uncharacterized protein YbjT (DUF2867 family)
MKTIVITGANGNVSSGVIQALQGTKAKVRALVRSEDKGAKLKSMGVDVFVGDLEHLDTLNAPFDGADSVWILSPPGARAPLQSSCALFAARKHGLTHVVRMSAVGAAHDAPTLNSRMHALSDSEVMAGGIPWTIVKPHFFMQNLAMSAQGIAKDGVMHLGLGEGRMGMIDARDIGVFAGKVLTSGGHAHKTYVPTGPASISMHDVAADLTKALGKTVKYQPVPVAAVVEQMKQWGLDHVNIQMLSDYFNAYSDNWGDFITHDFEDVTGSKPRSFADFAKDNAAIFSAASPPR